MGGCAGGVVAPEVSVQLFSSGDILNKESDFMVAAWLGFISQRVSGPGLQATRQHQFSMTG